ncbi:isopenicillin N synthase family oxygenase, partial [Mycobacterium sp. KBS0706]
RPQSPHLFAFRSGEQRCVASEAHTDFGCLTLLLQDEADGLQARLPDGSWLDIPPAKGHLVVNFGKLLERWTSGRILAAEHRVLSPGRERFSVPFFYEPRVDARIEPLALGDAEPYVPFLYGDHVWASLPRLRRHRPPCRRTIQSYARTRRPGPEDVHFGDAGQWAEMARFGRSGRGGRMPRGFAHIDPC